MSSKVYFSDLHIHNGQSWLKKLNKLIDAAGLGTIDFENKYTAIKMHFGEPGNLAFLRPNWAKVVADYVKEKGGKPFLTDCNTLYVGGRKNALDHMDSANLNGFSPMSTGCQIIIADGLKGNDEAYVPVKGGELVKEAKIGRAIMDADVFISLAHFKGHDQTGFGGALKNVGMGCGSRAGKNEMHCSTNPYIEADGCVGCGCCQKECAHDAIVIENKKARIVPEKCMGCGRCISACARNAVSHKLDATFEKLNMKIAEYAKAVTDGRPSFYINIVIDVSPKCDCWSCNDEAIVPNVGMFASFDPVALDIACADAVNKMPLNPYYQHKDLHEHEEQPDHFCHVNANTDWMVCMDHAVKLGIGSKAYELIQID